MGILRRAAGGVACALACACVESRPPLKSEDGPLAHDAFVWQRVWTEAVHRSVRSADPSYRRLIVLFEEVEWDGAEPLSRPTEADASELAALSRPIGVAVRVGLPDEGWSPVIEEATIDAVRRVRARSEAGGLRPAELHLDLDVPSGRLDDYAAWLPRVRATWPEVPLTVTGLPDWQGRPSLAELLDAVDGWVLQVHWLRYGPPYTLYDLDEARRAVSRAADSGHPFRLALPTYESGGVRADPAELAAEVERLRASHPEPLDGIAWFRLPVEGDALTWPASALAAVRAGRAPTRVAQAAATFSDGAWDVVLTSSGEDSLHGACVTVRWSGGRALDADALEGSVRLADGQAWWTVDTTLLPGAVRTVGWIRLSAGGRIDGVQTLDDLGACGVRAAPDAPG